MDIINAMVLDVGQMVLKNAIMVIVGDYKDGHYQADVVRLKIAQPHLLAEMENVLVLNAHIVVSVNHGNARMESAHKIDYAHF